MAVTLFGDEEGLVATREMDGVIGGLPGFEGARILETARTDALARMRIERRPRASAIPYAALRS